MTITTPHMTDGSNRLSDVAETSLLTLFCRAAETQTSDPIMIDDWAVQISKKISPLLESSESRLLRSLARNGVNSRLRVHIVLRAKRYDDYAKDFLRRHLDGTVVNIGCGMDTRFFRIDNGSLAFFDLDLPEVIGLKHDYVEEHPRYQMIARSAFDYAWMDQVDEMGKRPALFLAEGVLMYLPEENVKALIVELKSRFPGSELVCEVFSKAWLQKPFKSIVNQKMQRELGLGRNAEYQFGISHSREMESWGNGIHFLDDWCYFDTGHPKLGWMKYLQGIEFMRNVQWTVHYRLE